MTDMKRVNEIEEVHSMYKNGVISSPLEAPEIDYLLQTIKQQQEQIQRYEEYYRRVHDAVEKWHEDHQDQDKFIDDILMANVSHLPDFLRIAKEDGRHE